MVDRTEILPAEVPALHQLVVDGRAREAHLAQENRLLREQLALLKAGRFGRSSETIPAEQYRLFNEAEATEAEAPTEQETIDVPAHRRKKGGRKPLPENLPRKDVIHDLSDAEKVCPHDGHALTLIGEETSEQLDVIPQQVQVIRHIRRKYACPQCEQGVTIAPLPPQPIPKSLASPGTLAFVTTNKFVDGLPLYRQETLFKRLNIDISRATLANWVIRAGQLIQPLIDRLARELLTGRLIHMDETTLQVLKEPERPATSQSWLWVRRGGPPEKGIVLFDYDPHRNQAVPKRLLAGFTGTLVTDGYEAYAPVVRENGMTHAGCWAHARRKFNDALKVQGTQAKGKAGKAMEAMSFIRQLYAVERQAKEKHLDPEQRHALRQQQSRPVIERTRRWLDKSMRQVPPKSVLGKAMGYLDKQWDKLTGFLDDGLIPLDNNPAENAIRPFVIGRKAWLFADTVHGAEASANLYSLVETAKANGLEPYRYLRHVFTHLPAAQSPEQVDALLPTRVDAGMINAIPL